MSKKKSKMSKVKNMRIPSAVFYDNSLTTEALKLYGVILSRSGDLEKPCNDTHSYFAKIMGWKDNRTVRKYINELIEKKLIREEIRKETTRISKKAKYCGQAFVFKYYSYFPISYKHYYDMSFRNKDNPTVALEKYTPDDHNSTTMQDTIIAQPCKTPYTHGHAETHNGTAMLSGNYYDTKNETMNETPSDKSEEKTKKTKHIRFSPITIDGTKNDSGHCRGVPNSELQDFQKSERFATLELFLFSRCKDSAVIGTDVPICTQVLHALECGIAAAILARDEKTRESYLQYWDKYAELFRERESVNMLHDLRDFL